MNEDSNVSSQSVDQHPEVEPEKQSQPSVWDDHLLQYNPSFTLGHPYLQGQWRAYQDDKRKHMLKSIAITVFLVALALGSTQLMFYFMYYIVPALCLGYGIFSLRKWNKKNVQLAAREELLRAASGSLQEHKAAIVQYSVEEIGQTKMNVTQRGAPNARLVVEGGTSVPKYCGSWRICNWHTLSESDRLGLHSEYRSYITGKVWHGTDRSFALLTDNGTVLWFV